MTSWQLTIPSLLYVGLLFGIAWYTEKRGSQYRSGAWVYAMSLAVYCTSWTFYGAVGRGSESGWDFLPIYLGPALFLIFGHRLLKRVIRVSKRNNVTSIADFMAARYGKSQSIAVAVTVIATIGIVPYIALQLKALSLGFEVITGSDSFASDRFNFSIDAAMAIAAAMAFFAVVFGTRHIDRSEHHQGLILAVAFESVVKLIAFTAIALFCIWGLQGGLDDFWANWSVATNTTGETIGNPFANFHIDANFLTQTLLATLAMLCLPRQFHVGVVENTDERHVNTARWLFPLYLGVISVLIVPIAISGLMFSPAGTEPDTFVLSLPILAGNNGLTLLALLGGFSAATGMIIVSTVALSTMISNDLVMPLSLWASNKKISQQKNLNQRLARIRRTSIILLLMAAYAYYRALATYDSLASIGLLSFAAVAQFAPGLLLGLFWREVTSKAVLWGLCAGVLVWAYTLLLPVLVHAGLISQAVMAPEWPMIHPQALFAIKGMDPLTHGVVWSLGINTALVWLITQFSSRRVLERLQANAFIDDISDLQSSSDVTHLSGSITVRDLQALVGQFWEDGHQPPRLTTAINKYLSKANERARTELLKAAEADLASAIGTASARVVLRSALSGRDVEIGEVATVVGETTQALEFSREVLQATMENIEQAVSVIDADLRLVAWNKQYQDLFQYPDSLLSVGTHVADLIKFNAERGECGPGPIESHISKRLGHYQSRKAHSFERTRRDGRVLQMRGNPMPGGGFVTSFTDVSAYKQAQEALEEVNRTLEQRVTVRTQAVETARNDAEKANLSKTRFLAAASHDLLQPLNAARLFAAASKGLNEPAQLHDNLDKIDKSLTSAEELLSDLLDVSKLDTGSGQENTEHFALNDIFISLDREFGVVAKSKNLELAVRPCGFYVFGDQRLIRRAIQNLLANAIRYTPKGKVFMGARKRGNTIHVEVFDTGIGIDESDVSSIFEEFHRLRSKQDSAGLGLGLSIVDRICRLCGFKIDVQSTVGKGSRFTLTLPIGQITKKTKDISAALNQSNTLSAKTILCIDNEPDVLDGMETLLNRWGYNVIAVGDKASALQQGPVDCVLADYQLDHNQTGIETLMELEQKWGSLPAVAIITANHSPELREDTEARGYHLLNKPIRPATLRAWLNAQFC